MAGELIRNYGSWVDLEANGASITNNSFGQADDANMDLAATGQGGRPHVQFEIEFAFGTNPTANTPIALHAQDLDLLGGTSDMRSPSANNVGGYLTQVLVENTTSTQRRRFEVFDAPILAAIWLQNAGTGQTISTGWKLRYRSFTLVPA